MNYKHISISFGAGVILMAVIALFLHFQFPNIRIVKQTETITQIKYVPKDMTDCLDCVNSKGTITGEAQENKLYVKYQDKCKEATSTFTLDVQRQYKHMLQFQFVNTFMPTSYRNFGGDITYTYFIFERVGFSCGLMATDKNISPHIGVAYLW
jgi:hypothetical protein